MREIDNLEDLEDLKKESPLLIMFGGENCGVCKVVKPQINDMLLKNFPKMEGVYIDCHKNQMICSQNSIFTLPVIHVYFDGVKVTEEIRAFGINQLKEKIERLYNIWNEEINL